MGLVVDTNVFVSLERNNQPLDLSAWGPSEDVCISAVTVSELLVGVHRADSDARRKNRSDFVEAILNSVQILDFTTEIARLHADLQAHLMRLGQLIGAHDLLIGATARYLRMSLLTDYDNEFSRIPGLKVISFTPNG